MTAGELAHLIGLNATLDVQTRSGDTLTVPVRILDGREAFGSTHLLVTPMGGEGKAWVSADRVKVRGR